MEQNKWTEFYKATKNQPPSELLTRAVSLVTRKDSALDLGAGALKDTRFLIEQGFNSITVVDSEPQVEAGVKDLSSDKVKFVLSNYDSFSFPENSYDLVNAQYAIPFNTPETFNTMFARLTASLKVGGIFTGQFLGVNDEWNKSESKLTFHTKEQVLKLLTGYEIVELREQDKDARLSNGAPKHWHAFHVIAKRI